MWLKAYLRASKSGKAYEKALSFGLQRIAVALQRAIATSRRKLINLSTRPLGAALVGA